MVLNAITAFCLNFHGVCFRLIVTCTRPLVHLVRLCMNTKQDLPHKTCKQCVPGRHAEREKTRICDIFHNNSFALFTGLQVVCRMFSNECENRPDRRLVNDATVM